MKILITGINGMLGNSIFKYLSESDKFELYGVGRSKQVHHGLKNYFRGDLTNQNFVEKISHRNNFDWIIHCAAIVDLKYCEENPDDAYSTHVTGTKLLSRNNPDSKFIYISTDSIFDGFKGNYSENDEPNPLNIYAKTKHQGEEFIRKAQLAYYILRLNIIGQGSSSGNSLFEWAYQSLEEESYIFGFENVIFNPLHVEQVSNIIFKMIEIEPHYGIYHLGSPKPISKLEFLKQIADENGFDTHLISSKTVDFSSSNINRPLNTSLNIEKLKSLELGIDLKLNKYLRINK